MTDSATLAGRRHPSKPAAAPWLRHPATLAAGGFLAIRAIGLLALLWSPERAGRRLVEVLGAWDGGWYVRIAETGYADHLDLSAPAIDQSTGSLAFFPVYPMLIRLLSGLTGLDPRWAGVAISLAAGTAAAAGVAVLASSWGGQRAGVLAGLLWAAAPMSVVGALVYTEALFTALVVWAFVALRREAWLPASLLAAAAGLTRPTGIAVGAAVAAYAGWEWWQRRRSRDAVRTSEVPVAIATGSSNATPLVAGCLALVATPAFWLWVGVRAGRWDGWFAVQGEFWGSRFDGGASTVVLARNVVLGQILPGTGVLGLAVALSLLAALVLLALAVRARVWWPLLVYGAISMVMVIGSAGYFSSKLRFLVPIFVLTFPLARWLEGRSAPTQVVAILTAVAATTVSGTWLLLSWPYAI